jgi:hypothetical protein
VKTEEAVPQAAEASPGTAVNVSDISSLKWVTPCCLQWSTFLPQRKSTPVDLHGAFGLRSASYRSLICSEPRPRDLI